MVEIVFRPPNVVLFIAIGIVLVGVASVFLTKRENSRKIVGLVIVVAVALAMVLFLYRATTLIVDEEGIEIRGTANMELVWADVTNAYHEPDLRFSEYRPTVRSRGVAIGDYRSGRFILSNGDAAFVLAERADQAVILVTDELTYLFAPEQIELLVDAVNRFRRR